MYDDLFARLLAEGKVTKEDLMNGGTKDSMRVDDLVARGLKLNRGFGDTMQMTNTVAWKVFHSQRGKLGQWEDLGSNHNARTDAGAAWVAGLLGGAGTTAPAKYIGLTTDAVSPIKTDTVLPSELTTNGLGRALGTYTLTVGTPASLNAQVTWTITYTFTYTGSTQVIVAKGGLFTAASLGILAFETVLPSTATVSGNGDQIACTWTVQA